jgi:hypothetical protein
LNSALREGRQWPGMRRTTQEMSIMKITASARRGPAIALVFMLACAAVASPGSICECGEIPAGPASSFAVLSGMWQRPDGGYIIDIKAVAESGAMEAFYFNPDPIHVAAAQAVLDGDKLRIYVKLQDVNYPGSTYNLTYDPADDCLKGTYYQAVAGETYEVFFVRLKQ